MEGNVTPLFRRLAFPQIPQDHIQLCALGQYGTLLLVCDMRQPHLEYYCSHPMGLVYGAYMAEQVPQSHDGLGLASVSLAAETVTSGACRDE